MNSIQDALKGGDRRSLGRTEEVVLWVLADRERLADLFQCLFDGDEIVRMRASDGLEKICRQTPEWFGAYTERLLTEVAGIEQPSVQWHLAQMLTEIPLTAGDRTRAIAVLKRNLERYQDWIVTNLTLEALATFAGEDAALRRAMPAILKRYENSRHKSVVSRVRKLLRVFGEAS